MKSFWSMSLSVVLGGVFIVSAQSVQAAWQEPNCDPAAAGGPGASGCNISAPLNVSEADQTKMGSITVNTGFVLGTEDGGETSAVGDITLTLPGGIISDDMVNDNITAQKFTRSGGFTNAVDLGTWSLTDNGTAEVVGSLDSGALSITDQWVNVTGDTMSGALSTTAPALAYLLTVNPTALPTNTNAIRITLPETGSSTAGYGINITGGTSGSLMYLNTKDNTTLASSEGPALEIKVESGNGSNAKGIRIASYSTSATAYPVDVVLDTTAKPERGINVENNANTTNMFGVYAVSKVISGKGVGVYGGAGGSGSTNDTNVPVGVFGYVSDTASTAGGIGVYGNSKDANGIGVSGYATQNNGLGVKGKSVGTPSAGGFFTGYVGVLGSTNGSASIVSASYPANSGVIGEGYNYGGYFFTYGAGPNVGVYGKGTVGVQGIGTTGVIGLGGGVTTPSVSTGSIGVYGESGSDVGIYGWSNTNNGIYGKSVGGSGVYGSSDDTLDASNNAAVKGVATNTYGMAGISTSQAGVYGETSSSSNPAVIGKSTYTATSSGIGGKFTGGRGIVAETSVDSGIAVEATATATEADGVYAHTTGSSDIDGFHEYGDGYAIKAESDQGTALYAKGKRYAAWFDGSIVANNVFTQNLPTWPYESKSVSGHGTRLTQSEFANLKNMVFDGSEIWALSINTAGDDFILRIDPQTLAVNTKYMSSGTTWDKVSELVPYPPSANGGGVYLFDGDNDKVYTYLKKNLSPTSVSSSGAKYKINTAIYYPTSNPATTMFVVGTIYGPYYSTLVSSFSYQFISLPAGSQGWGSITDFVDEGGSICMLNDLGDRADEVICGSYDRDTSAWNLSVRATLPYDDVNDQTAKDMVSDGQHIWVYMSYPDDIDSIVRVGVRETEEYYLTSNGKYDGVYELLAITDPGMVFDGYSIWIPGSGGLGRFFPTELITSKSIAYEDDRNSRGNVIFDGTNVYVATSSNELRKYYSGHGEGYSTSFYTRGVNIIGTAPAGGAEHLYCIKVVSGTIFDADSSAAGVQLPDGPCYGSVSGF